MPLYDMTYRDVAVKHSIIEARDQRYAELVANRWVASREVPTRLLQVTHHLVATEEILLDEDRAQIKMEDDHAKERLRIEAEKASKKAALGSKVQPIQRPSV